MATNKFNRNVEISNEEKSALSSVEKHVQIVSVKGNEVRVEIAKWEAYGKSRLYTRVQIGNSKYESFIDLKDDSDLSFGLDNESAVTALIEVIAGLMPVENPIEEIEVEIVGADEDEVVEMIFPYKYQMAAHDVSEVYDAFYAVQFGISVRLICKRKDVEKMKYAVAYAHRNEDRWPEKAMIAYRAAGGK
jgi:hypothetical protein